jgi:hypothetical protein
VAVRVRVFGGFQRGVVAQPFVPLRFTAKMICQAPDSLLKRLCIPLRREILHRDNRWRSRGLEVRLFPHARRPTCPSANRQRQPGGGKSAARRGARPRCSMRGMGLRCAVSGSKSGFGIAFHLSQRRNNARTLVHLLGCAWQEQGTSISPNPLRRLTAAVGS